ncbi:MAG: cupin domain-containing protein, partial [Burkholderiales bacterium]
MDADEGDRGDKIRQKEKVKRQNEKWDGSRQWALGNRLRAPSKELLIKKFSEFSELCVSVVNFPKKLKGEKMATADSSQVDEVQIFDVSEAMKKRDHLSGRVDMARSPNSFIAVFQTRPRGGETHIHQHPDSDQILFILDGELTVEGLSGRFILKPNQGVLIPSGVHYGFTNTTERDVVFLTMRTESSGGRRVAYVA